MTENEFLLADRIAKIKSIDEQYNISSLGYIAFSGGKDSVVLHHLIDEALPGNLIPRVYVNTGIEYKDIVLFVKEMQKKDKRIEIISAGVNIKKMLEEKGYPFKSKEHSKRIYNYYSGQRNKLILKYFRKIKSDYRQCPKALMYQIKELPFKISSKCCDELKKKPSARWMKQNNRSVTITGMRKEEGGARSNIDCLSFVQGKLKRFHPLSVVSESFENWFIEERKN